MNGSRISEKMKTFYIVETLNGNFILKEESKLKENDSIEYEIYCYDLATAKKEFRQHIKDMQNN